MRAPLPDPATNIKGLCTTARICVWLWEWRKAENLYCFRVIVGALTLILKRVRELYDTDTRHLNLRVAVDDKMSDRQVSW